MSRESSLGRQGGYKNRIVEKQTVSAFELLRPTRGVSLHFVIGLCGL